MPFDKRLFDKAGQLIDKTQNEQLEGFDRELFAQIGEMTDQGNVKLISAKVPLVEMFGYATQLRSITQGRASYSMEFLHYAEVPQNIAEKIMGEKEDKK